MIEPLIQGRWARVLCLLIVVACTLAPWAMYLAVFCRELFDNVETVKLLFLCVAAGLPLLLFHLALLTFASIKALDPVNTEEKLEAFVLKFIAFASLLNVLPVLFPTVLQLFFQFLGLRSGLALCAVLALAQGGAVAYVVWCCSTSASAKAQNKASEIP